MQVKVSSLTNNYLYQALTLIFFLVATLIIFSSPSVANAQVPSALSNAPNLHSDDDSNVNTDDTTNDNTPRINGSGVASDATSVTVTATKGSDTITGTDSSVSGGTYEVTLPTLADGEWSIKAAQTNASGTSSDSPELTVTIDTATPSAPTLALDNNTYQTHPTPVSYTHLTLPTKA